MSVAAALAPPADRKRIAALTLAALGVVFGDIGTSPLYAMQGMLHARHTAAAHATTNVLGVLSLIFWALMIVVSLKYVVFVMRADNRGEGGILALMALVRASAAISPRRRRDRPDPRHRSAPRCSTATA